MAESLIKFTIYTWYDRQSPVQNRNFRRWNRNIAGGKDRFDVIVFYSDENAKKEMEKYPWLRFWRLHSDMQNLHTGLMNEAMRYGRTDILVFVSPWVLARKNDLYCLANRVRGDVALVWTSLRRKFARTKANPALNLLDRFRWLFCSGRLEVYAHLNHPFDFYDCGFFAFHKKSLGLVLKEADPVERQKMFRGDRDSSAGRLNFYLFHLFTRHGLASFNEGRLRSFQCEKKYPKIFYSHASTWRLLKTTLAEKEFHYPLNVYRVLMPVMQISQLLFLALVWFYPLKSFAFLGFYLVLGSGMIVEIFLNKKSWPASILLLWFFSWLVA